jgi:hypothetical protein
MDNAERLDTDNLIHKAERLVNDGNMTRAANAVIPVQRIQDENGGYELFLIGVRIPVDQRDALKFDILRSLA